MDVLKQAWQRIEELFKRLSPSQRLTLSILGVVVLFSLGLLMTTAGKDGLAPLTRGDTPPDVVGRIQSFLEEQGSPYENRGGTLYVPYSQRDRLWFKLQEDGKPLAGKDPFEWLYDTDFTSTKQRLDLRYVDSTERELKRWLRAMDAVQGAEVKIAPLPDTAAAMLTGQEPEASVYLQLKPGKALDANNVMAIAGLVSHAVPGLKPHKVNISDTQGRSYEVPADQDAFAKVLSKTQAEKEKEQELKRKILDVLSYIKPEPLVSVNVDLDLNQSRHGSRQYGETVPVEEGRSSRSETGTTKALPPGGPISLNVSADSSISLHSTVDQKASKTVSKPSESYLDVVEYPVRTREITAAVMLPKQTVDAKQLKVDDIKNDVAHAIGVQDLTKIQVTASPYPEPIRIPEPTSWALALDFLREHWDRLALTFAILISLGIIYGIVQRAIPRDIGVEIERLKAQLATQAHDEVVAVEGGGDVRIAQIRQSVKEVVQRNPRNVASILRRWITRG